MLGFTWRDAEKRLAALGVQATFRSAYKPLLHFFLEEADTVGLKQVTIRTPSHEIGTAERFRAEEQEIRSRYLTV